MRMISIALSVVFLFLCAPCAHCEEETKPKLWTRSASLGYSKATGNTQKSNLSFGLSANRKTEDNEFTIKGDAYYASSDNKMDRQKWSGLMRYAFSFGNKKWYNFYRLEGNHDRFANIDYRIIPSVGIGYWFSDTPDWKAMTEASIGLEHTNFKDETKNSNEPVLIPRTFLEKRFIGESRISQDITFYPSLKDTGEYRFHSETVLITPINEYLALRFSLIDDYNSDPPQNTKRSDIMFMSSLKYSF